MPTAEEKYQKFKNERFANCDAKEIMKADKMMITIYNHLDTDITDAKITHDSHPTTIGEIKKNDYASRKISIKIADFDDPKIDPNKSSEYVKFTCTVTVKGKGTEKDTTFDLECQVHPKYAFHPEVEAAQVIDEAAHVSICPMPDPKWTHEDKFAKLAIHVSPDSPPEPKDFKLETDEDKKKEKEEADKKKEEDEDSNDEEDYNTDSEEEKQKRAQKKKEAAEAARKTSG